MSIDLAAWTDYLAQPFAGRPVIVGFDPLAAMPSQVAQLAAWGARRPLLVARGTGTGPLPSAEDADILVLDAGSTSMMSEDVRAMARLAARLPAEVVERVNAYDPDRQAVWLLSPFVDVSSLLGRPVFGGRSPGASALEDKTTVDQMWDELRVPRAPSATVPTDHDLLVGAAAPLDAGSGTVWSGDCRDGVQGGADFVRWVRSANDATAAAEFFAPRCDRVRVMPFLDGVPCSIHGLVLPDGVAVLRPLELVVLRRSDSARFIYAGLSTWWDPPPGDREAMRRLARRTGELLHNRIGYRGGFGIDGVLTANGFLPTELNPRFSGGFGPLARAMPDLPLWLVQLNLVAGRDPGIGAAALEELLVCAADATRSGQAVGVASAVRRTDTETVDVVATDGCLREAAIGEPPSGAMSAGPNAMGTFVRFMPAPGTLHPGERMAPYAVAALRFADERWGTEFGALEAAPDRRAAV